MFILQELRDFESPMSREGWIGNVQQPTNRVELSIEIHADFSLEKAFRTLN
jgi:hypothetical protein